MNLSHHSLSKPKRTDQTGAGLPLTYHLGYQANFNLPASPCLLLGSVRLRTTQQGLMELSLCLMLVGVLFPQKKEARRRGLPRRRVVVKTHVSSLTSALQAWSETLKWSLGIKGSHES